MVTVLPRNSPTPIAAHRHHGDLARHELRLSPLQIR
jgi:hypothetical protein